MKKLRSTAHIRSLWATATLAALAATCSGAVETSDVARRLEAMPPSHPRLFLGPGAEAGLKQRIAASPMLGQIEAAILREADRMLSTAPVEQVLIGRRMLDKSRTVLTRALHLGLAWRLTGERKYVDRARTELVAAARFSDWHPSAFLDVAEMTAGVGIGYDWFYSEFDDATRKLLREAIVEKGLKVGVWNTAWTRMVHNWNQVCNGGLTVGAIAVAESTPELSAQLIARAINTIPTAMNEYGPDGACTEGPGYWDYGTTYNVVLISALQSALGSDFGLTQISSYMATADYYLHATGPSGLPFNYSDCRRGARGVAPAMFWFANQRNESHLLWSEWSNLKQAGSSDSDGSEPYINLPLLLLWMSPTLAQPTRPVALSWTGHGRTPVAFHRSSWAPDASFVAIKGGSPGTTHGHMDVGAFVMDADGVRWADDLGLQDYHSLESKGVKMWEMTQESDRWKVFRLGTSSHNVLMVDGQQQRMNADARIVRAKAGRTVVDTSAVYQGQLAKAHRGVALQPDRMVQVQDEFTTLDKTTTVRWAMVTFADVKVDALGRATLSQAGKTLSFRVLEPANAELKIYPTDPPPSDFDARNEGSRLLGFEVQLPAGTAQRLRVQLVPQNTLATPIDVTPLSEW